jgi:hypothetical protein
MMTSASSNCKGVSQAVVDYIDNLRVLIILIVYLLLVKKSSKGYRYRGYKTNTAINSAY